MTDRPPSNRSWPLSDTPPSRLERIDIATIYALRRWSAHPLTKLAQAIGLLGGGWPIATACGATLASGLVLRRPRLVRAGMRMIAADAMAAAIKWVTKDRVDRTRPSHMLDTGRYQMTRGRSKEPCMHSFPSGHSARAMAIATAAAREIPEARVACLGAATAIAASQVPRHTHFPSDIVAGVAIGVLAEVITNFVWTRLTRSGDVD